MGSEKAEFFLERSSKKWGGIRKSWREYRLPFRIVIVRKENSIGFAFRGERLLKVEGTNERKAYEKQEKRIEEGKEKE